MPSFQELFLSLIGHVPAGRTGRVTQAASQMFQNLRRERKSQAPPIFEGNNRLRRDIGLPPLDRRGLPL
jgi:hypothetical protein